MSNKKPVDVFDRLNKGASPIYRTIYVMFRSIDPYIQYLLLTTYGRQILSNFGLVTHPLEKETIWMFLFMTSVSAIKQIIYVSYIMQEKMNLSIAIIAPNSA